MSATLHCCREMDAHLREKSMPIVYNQRFREYGIEILDGGASVQLIEYCPWCGSTLPTSLRDRWFDRVRELGLEPESSNLPEEMKSDAWWRNPPFGGSR